jgi:hypothetical protein
MKILALFMVIVIISLYSFSGTVITAQPIAKKTCCAKSGRVQGCKHQKKQGATNDCGSTCALFSCNMCCFLIIEPVRVEDNVFYHIEKPVTPYKIGNLSEYHPTGWQPPEVYS